MSKEFKYEVKFEFTRDGQEYLLEKVWSESIGKRIIKAELGLDPAVDNSNGDIRYQTNDAAIFAELLKLCVLHSAGGWWCSEPMPKDYIVFHLPQRGKKHSGCQDYKEKTEQSGSTTL